MRDDVDEKKIFSHLTEDKNIRQFVAGMKSCRDMRCLSVKKRERESWLRSAHIYLFRRYEYFHELAREVYVFWCRERRN